MFDHWRTKSHLRWLLCVLFLMGCQPLIKVAQPAAQQNLKPRTPTAGQLAYIGGDGNVYVTAADKSTKIAITQDATTSAEGNGRSYHRVAWSPDGWLAFAAVERTMNTTRSELFVAAPGKPAQLVGQSDANFVIYLYWSPAPCPAQPTCHQLAYLIGGKQTITLHIVTIDGDFVNNAEVGAGQPFYFSWAAQGDQLIWHTGGGGRFNPQARIALYTLAQHTPTNLPDSPGLFVAPAWSPTGLAWLDVVEMPQGQLLRHVTATNLTATPIIQAKHEIGFAWSPNGKQIAYATRFYGDDPFFDSIYVYDVATGASRLLTDKGLHVQAFFWSPDSTRLGYIHWLPIANENWAQWRVYNLTTNRDRGYDAFNPSFSMRMVIDSFNQYAQSDRLWSPDGRYLTFADRDYNLVEHVWLIDTQAGPEAKPIRVDDGALGVWSWQ